MYTKNPNRLETVVAEYLKTMSKEDLDYPTMQKVYKMIQQRQPFDHIIREYNETYFRESMWTLKRKAWLIHD